MARPELLSLVQVHHAQVMCVNFVLWCFIVCLLFSLYFFSTMQCVLLESCADGNSDKELQAEELEEILSKLKESVQSDSRQVAVWNSLGLILLKSGRIKV